MIRRSIITIGCLALSCAEQIPGIPPPGDEVYFPIGIAVLPDADQRDAHLAVLSSNFDQRFNAGAVTTYRIDDLFEMAGDGTGDVVYSDTLRPAQSDTVQIFSFGGDLVYVPRGAGKGHLFAAARGRNVVTMIDVDTGAQKLMSCTTPGDSIELVPGSECSRAYVASTGFADPFALGVATANSSRPDLVAIGHLATRQSENVILGAVSLANVQVFEDRTAIEAGTRSGEMEEPVTTTTLLSFGGSSGIMFAGDILDLSSVFLSTNLATAPDLVVASFVPTVNGNGQYQLVLQQGSGQTITLSTQISAIEMRSLAIAPFAEGEKPTRAYASVRFTAPGGEFNSGIAVLDIGGDRMRVLSVLELGEELQRPFLRDLVVGHRLTRVAYIGDIRRDKLFIVDVTTDEPILIKEIDGRAQREIDGKQVQARLLDGPSQIAFASRGDRTLGFVTNFANSTLAVVDVSDPDPKKHRIIARLGRNIDSSGETEKP